MEPALAVTLFWLLFAGTHIGLATRRIRAVLVGRLGELGFMLGFSLVAATGFTLLVRYYAAHRFEGLPGLALGDVTPLGWILAAAVAVGITLAIAGVLVFPASPMALFGHDAGAPRGLERITRHPFFAGFALASVAHALLARQLVGTAFFGTMALLTVVGAWHQDRKLLALRGRAYADYLAATSAVPFAAVLAGRQRLVWRDLPLVPLAVSVALTFLLRTVHAGIFSAGGSWVIGFTVGGAAILGVASWRRAHRPRRAELAPSTT